MNINGIEGPPGRRETRKQDRRQAIVDAARRSFLDDGYAATSMSGLLKTLGGSKATLWRYFRSKEELFTAVIEDVTVERRREMEEALATSPDVETTLALFCRSFMEKTSHPDAIGAWRMIVGESGRFPELGRIFYETAAGRVEKALTDYLAAQKEAGVLQGEEPRNMAQSLLGLCATRHNQQVWGVTPPGDTASDARRFAGYFMRLFAARRD